MPIFDESVHENDNHKLRSLGRKIDGNHSIVAIDLLAGELKTRRYELRIELCMTCGSDFFDFLKPAPFKLESPLKAQAASCGIKNA